MFTIYVLDENYKYEQKQNLQTIIRNTKFISKRAQATETLDVITIDKILTSAVKCPDSSKNKQLTTTINFYSSCFGLFKLLVTFLIFQAMFSWSSLPMDLIDEGFSNLSNLSLKLTSVLNNLLVDGVIAGWVEL